MVLIGYWPLQENSGNTAHDYAGDNNFSNNGATSNTGVVGSSGYVFSESSNDYLSLGSIPDLTGGFTVSAWMYWTGNDGDADTFIDFGWGPSETNNYIRFTNIPGDWTMRLRGAEGNDSSRKFPFEISASKWHHIAVSSTSDGSVNAYLDGSLSGRDTSTFASLSSFTGSGEVYLGRSYTTGSNRSFGGRASEIRLYDHSLSQAEISYLYNAVNQGRLTSGKKSV